jgi:sigma-B regulation protein RsbU (phosphoserine phosphatase)
LDKPALILVVDDDEGNRESLRRRLDRRGYTTAVAIDGNDALDQISKRAFDLVILDVMMPGINGLEVLDRVRKTLSPMQLPIIMATARDQSEDVVAALDRGANDYVTKPLDFAVVSARVRSQLLVKQSIDQILALETDLQSRNEQLNIANDKLVKAAERTARELHAAARVQQAFLPHANPQVPGAAFAWIFEPCTELAGDSLNVVQLDEQRIGLYVLDVSGHGVAASLLAVTVTRMLSPSTSGDSFVLQTRDNKARQVVPPCEVATRLAKNFSIESTEQFITLFYAVYDTKTRELSYISAGHPGAIRVSAGSTPVILDGSGLPIGIGEKYEQQSVTLQSGDRLYLYSDGVTEAMDAERSLFGTDRLIKCLADSSGESLTHSIARVQAELVAWQAGSPSRDDISILAMECV